MMPADTRRPGHHWERKDRKLMVLNPRENTRKKAPSSMKESEGTR